MRLEKASLLIGSETARTIFRENERMKKSQIVETILSRPAEEREALLSSCIERLSAIVREPDSEETLKKKSCRLLQKFSERIPTLESYLSKEILSIFLSTFENKQSHPRRHALRIQSAPHLAGLSHPLTCFDTYEIKLSQIAEETALLIRDDYMKAKQIGERLERETVQNEKQKYMIIENQPFILTGLPKTTNDVEEYFQACCTTDTRLLISAHESTDHPERRTHFWLPSELQTLHLKDGWRIDHQESHLLYRSVHPNQNGRIPELHETTLHIHTPTGEEKTLTHLHYDGWADRQAPSDQVLYSLALDRMQELNPEGKTVGINCVGGVGRTGNIAICYLQRLLIDRALQAGKAPHEIQINIPRLIAQFREKRKIIGSNINHIVSIYSMTEHYFTRT